MQLEKYTSAELNELSRLMLAGIAKLTRSPNPDIEYAVKLDQWRRRILADNDYVGEAIAAPTS